MTAPEPRRGGFVAGNAELDLRLEQAFVRYDEAFHSRRRAPHATLVAARMDLSLLLWQDEDAPAQVREQLAVDGDELLRDTPPL